MSRSGRPARLLARCGPWLVVVAAVLVANGSYLLHLTHASPLVPASGLGGASTGLLAGAHALDPNDGFTAQALGHRAAQDLLHGQWPWWNPFEGLGAPLAGEMQSAPFLPTTLLLHWSWGQEYALMVLEVVAGWATLGLLTTLGVRRWLAAAAAVAFALDGTLAWFRHAAANPVAFAPLLLWGVELALRKRRGGIGLVAVAVALGIYAGFPETAYLDDLLALVWTLARLAAPTAAGDSRLAAGDSRLAAGGRCAAGAGLGLLLAAPILVPFVDYLRVADVGGHGSAFAAVSLPASALEVLATPYSLGPLYALSSQATAHGVTIWPSLGGFTTVALLLLALVGAVGRPWRGPRLALAGWILVALGRTFGIPGVDGLVNAVPGVRHVAFYVYAYPSWELAIVILAGLGLEDVAARRASRRRVGVAIGLAGLAGAIGLGLAAGTRHQSSAAIATSPWWLGSTGWVLVSLLAVGGGLLASWSGRDRFTRLSCAGPACFLVLEAVAGFAIPTLSAPRTVFVDTATVRYLQTHAGFGRVYSLANPLYPNYGSYWHIASLNVNDVPTPALWSDFVHRELGRQLDPHLFLARPVPVEEQAAEELLASHAAAFRSAGVTLVLTQPRQPLLPALAGLLRLVHRGLTAWVYRLPGAAPYAQAYGPCAVRVDSWDTMTTYCSGPGALLRRELWMPGWTATRDGRPVPLARAGTYFQAVALPTGTSRFQFAFSPPYEVDGAVAAVIGLVILLGGGWQGGRSWRRGYPPPAGR